MDKVVELVGGGSVIFSLDTGLNIKTVILKVLIPVSISRLRIGESQFKSRYQD